MGGTAHGLIRYGNDGNVQISDGAAPLVSFGSTPTIGSGTYWSARDTGGTVHGLLGIPSDNNTYLNAFNNLYVTASTAWFNCNVVVPNNALYYGKNMAAAPVALLGVGNDNITRLAQGAPSETWIYAAAGARVVLNAAVMVVGTLSPAGTVAIGGALTVAGNTGLSGSLQVNGASNLYARLNVNNSVGATITGDIATNLIHIFGGGITVDQNATISGQTNIQSCQIYIPSGNDPLTIAADAGHYARIRYSVANMRLWSAGAFYDGSYRIADESAGQIRFTIDTSGNTTVGVVAYGRPTYGLTAICKSIKTFISALPAIIFFTRWWLYRDRRQSFRRSGQLEWRHLHQLDPHRLSCLCPRRRPVLRGDQHVLVGRCRLCARRLRVLEPRLFCRQPRRAGQQRRPQCLW